MADLENPGLTTAGAGKGEDLGNKSQVAPMNAKAVAIMQAAKALFLEHGFGAVSMDQIARQAGVSKATVYAHFTSKEKLFWHAFETSKHMGWAIVDYSAKDGRIEATDKSFWFGQTADIVIRVQTAGALGARLDIRSQSEQGARDFGSNIARLSAYLKAL